MKLATTLLTLIASLTTDVALAATCHQYDIVINSTVSSNFGSANNSVREVAIVREQGIRNNQFELLIRYPGDLNGFDVKSGAIELMSNSSFAKNKGIASAAFDMGSTSYSNNIFTFKPLIGLISDEVKEQPFINTTGSEVTSATTNTSSLSSTGTASNLSDLVNSNQVIYPNSFNNSFNGNNFSSQCGSSFSTGYSDNSLHNNWYITATLNTNPCVDQKKLEDKRQQSETKEKKLDLLAQLSMLV